MPTPAELEWRLLDEANEDSCGLWEPCWALRTDLTLDLTDAELGAVIEPVMRCLVHRGLIELYRNQWARHEFVPVALEQADDLLADPVNWSAPPTDDYWAVWFGATDAGEREWRKLQSQRAQAAHQS
jgi:hypothetical protein